MPRSFAIGDIHGDLAALRTVISRLPPLTAADTLVFLGDYVDRGPHSAQVVDYLMQLPEKTDARIVALRGNHEDAWLRVLDEGWDNFIAAPHTGTLAALRSYTGGAYPETIDEPTSAELDAMSNATFYPARVVEWFRSLPYWYEDENAIYLHGCVPSRKDGTFPHPRDVDPQGTLAWCSDPLFFKSYAGKRIVVGHTRTKALPQDLSEYTPDDPTDLFRHGNVFGLDTGCGAGGFLTGLELPALRVYESRAPEDR